MKQTIRLTESQLHDVIREAVDRIINEGELEEGFFGDLWNGVKGTAKGVGSQIGQQYQNAKANYYSGQAQGYQQQIQRKMQQLEQQKANIEQQIEELQQQLQSAQGKSNAAVDKANQMANSGYGNGRNYRYRYN